MGRHKSVDPHHVFDVSKPGRSAPSHTARPVIIDQREVGSDPMVTGATGSEGLMTHNAKPVVPIAISSGEHEHSDEAPKEPGSNQTDNFFGNTPESAAGEQSSYTPQAPSESAPAAVEPFSGNGGSEHSKPAETQTTDSSPADSQPLDDKPPLPAGLTAPGADDPVGLSNSELPGAMMPIASGVPSENQTNTPGVNQENGDTANSPSTSHETPKNTEELPAVPENIGEIETLPFPAHPHHNHFVAEKSGRKWLIPAMLILVIGIFFALDSGVIGSGNLPFEIIKEKEVAITPQPVESAAPPAAQTPTQPAAPPAVEVSRYAVAGTPLSFNYPTVWGTPSVTPDPGFSKRGGTNKSDGVYTHLVNFAGNKDIQVALSSNKYLPPPRAAQYYDFLQWCTGTHDSKFYRQKLLFSTTAGVDTPSTITCSDGPFGDANKLDELTIVQKNTKDAAGKAAGDIYTKNLTGKEFVVLRVKDAVMTNGDAVKQLLSTVKTAP